MAKFRFRFATVLDVRKTREQDALSALGAAQRNYQQALAHKQSLQMELQDSLLRREKLGMDPTPALSFQIEQNFIIGTKQRIIQADQSIVRASRGAEKALRNYLAARKQTRMIETLEEKDRREFKVEQARKEQKRLDEIVVLRARLKEREETA